MHALPPSGPSVQITDLFNSLHMNIPQILFRIPALFQLLYEPCYYCKRRLNDVDGYPLGRIGWLPYSPKPAPPPTSASDKDKEKSAEGEKAEGEKEEEKAKANGEKKEDCDVAMADGEKTDGPAKESDKEEDKAEPKEDSHMEVDTDDKEKKEEGRWVCWHQSCQNR